MTIQHLQNRVYEYYQDFQSKAHEACQDLQNRAHSVYQKIGFISPAKLVKAVLITAVALAAMGSFNFNADMPQGSLRIRDCYSISDCPDIDPAIVHPREIDAIKVITGNDNLNVFNQASWKKVQHLLRLEGFDPREKVPILVADYDYNGASNPSYAAHLFKQLNLEFDIKYNVIKKRSDFVNIFKSAKKINNLKHVIIFAHGDASNIILDAERVILDGEKKLLLKEYLDIKDNFSEDLTGLAPNGNIILVSCSTGGLKKDSNNRLDNIAQKIASDSKITVIAPTTVVGSYFIKYSSDVSKISFFHPEDLLKYFLFNSGKNAFMSFKPTFQDCHPELDDTQLTLNERSVRTAIRKELISSSLLPEAIPKEFADQFLQTCDDDLRDKMLYFSAHEKENKFLNADRNAKHLAIFADQFDFRFKEVKILKEICETISMTPGNIAVVVIQAHGTPEKGMILSKDETIEERITGDENHQQCFSKVSKDGTIVLIGGSVGQSMGDKSNLAQRIADAAQRRVIAPTCLVGSDRIKVKLIEPLELEHPSHSFFLNLIFCCKENNKNLFKVFEPQANNT